MTHTILTCAKSMFLLKHSLATTRELPIMLPTPRRRGAPQPKSNFAPQLHFLQERREILQGKHRSLLIASDTSNLVSNSSNRRTSGKGSRTPRDIQEQTHGIDLEPMASVRQQTLPFPHSSSESASVRTNSVEKAADTKQDRERGSLASASVKEQVKKSWTEARDSSVNSRSDAKGRVQDALKEGTPVAGGTNFPVHGHEGKLGEEGRDSGQNGVFGEGPYEVLLNDWGKFELHRFKSEGKAFDYFSTVNPDVAHRLTLNGKELARHVYGVSLHFILPWSLYQCVTICRLCL